MVTQRALPSSRTAVTVPTASTCPVTMCPPMRSPSARERSRLTAAPGCSAPSVVRPSVSGITSAENPDPASEAMVTHTPLTAMLSPSLAPATARSASIARRPRSPFCSAAILPNSSTMPLNMTSAYTVAGHDDVGPGAVDGHILQQARAFEGGDTMPSHRGGCTRTTDDARRDHRDHLVDQAGVEGCAVHGGPTFDEHADHAVLTEMAQHRAEVHAALAAGQHPHVDTAPAKLGDARLGRSPRSGHQRATGAPAQNPPRPGDAQAAAKHDP